MTKFKFHTENQQIIGATCVEKKNQLDVTECFIALMKLKLN